MTTANASNYPQPLTELHRNSAVETLSNQPSAVWFCASRDDVAPSACSWRSSSIDSSTTHSLVPSAQPAGT